MSQKSPGRPAVRIAVIAVAALVVIAVAVPFVYIHFIEGSAPAKLSLSASGGSSGPSVPLDGTWSVTSGSTAGYRVGEVLVGQNNTAVGRTTDVTGSLAIKGTRVVSGSFTANLTSVHSDQQQRDGQFRRIMDTANDSTATFTLTDPIDLRTPPASGVPISVKAVGKLTLRGDTRPVTIDLTAEHLGATLEVLGNIPIVFSDWKIPQPDFPGIAKVQDHGTLEFLLRLTPGASSPATTSVPPTTIARGGFRGPPGGGSPQITVSPTTVAPLQLGH